MIDTDFCSSPGAASIGQKYDRPTVAAFFEESGWSNYQLFLTAFAICVEFEGPAAAREIAKLSREDVFLEIGAQAPRGGLQ